MHLKKLQNLEIQINNTLNSGTLSPQDTHKALNALTYCNKARTSLDYSRNMEGVFYLNKAEEIVIKLLESK